jgi:EmrB/QacA subfamily drug resistance transporter
MTSNTVQTPEIQIQLDNLQQHNANVNAIIPTSAVNTTEVINNEDVGGQVAVRSKLRLTIILTTLFASFRLQERAITQAKSFQVCLFVSALDVTIVGTIVPSIAHDLNSASGYTWIGGAYTLSNAVASPIWAKLSDIWGRKLMMLTALALFLASSTICATAHDMNTLIAGRSLQGVAGGGLLLLVMITVSDMFSMRTRSLLIGLMEGIWAVAGGVGPIIGGAFSSGASWRWCFYLNLPICGVAFFLLLAFLDVKHEHTSFKDGAKAIDWYGLFSFLAFALMLLLGLNFGGVTFPWDSAKVVTLIVVGTCMICVFVYSEAKLARYPLMPLGVFKDRSSVAILLVGFFHGLTYMGAEYYTPLYFQAVKQQSAFRSGLLVAPLYVTTAVLGIVAGVIPHRTGRYREIIVLGMLGLSVGSGLFISLKSSTSLGGAIGLQLVFGLGNGLLFNPPTIAIQNQGEQQDVATAISTFTFIRQLATSVSIIVGGVVFQNSMDIQHREKLSSPSLGIAPDVLAKLTGKEANANLGVPSTLSDERQRAAILDSFAWSIRNMWIMYTAFAGLGFLSSLWIKHVLLKAGHSETVTGIKKKPAEEGT